MDGTCSMHGEVRNISILDGNHEGKEWLGRPNRRCWKWILEK